MHARYYLSCSYPISNRTYSSFTLDVLHLFSPARSIHRLFHHCQGAQSFISSKHRKQREVDIPSVLPSLPFSCATSRMESSTSCVAMACFRLCLSSRLAVLGCVGAHGTQYHHIWLSDRKAWAKKEKEQDIQQTTIKAM